MCFIKINEKGDVDLNKIIQSLVKEVVRIEVSGKKLLNGTVVDLGTDVVVIFNGTVFVYIPLHHIQSFEVDKNNEYDIKVPTEFPSIIAEDKNDNLSLRQIITQAKGNYVELYVTGGQPLHGYITTIMDNYFVFDSPVYKRIYISLSHLKWLIPYSKNERPYGLDNNVIPLQLNHKLLAGTFKEQVEKFKNEIVIFNIEGHKSHIGKINNVEEQIVEIQSARNRPVYINIDHIKSVHQV